MMQNDGDSDYGSEFSDGEAAIINQLLLSTSDTAQTISQNQITTIDYHHDAPQLRIFHASSAESLAQKSGRATVVEREGLLHVNPEYSDSVKSLVEVPNKSYVVDENDTRPPLERFRSPPRKSFSVSDLISPSWCEMQYFLTLKYLNGKKNRTPAMTEGTKVHKKLEEQIYTTVKVAIATQEDKWGLKLWNVIQGLRTLRETGHTRELEVWGVIHGQVVTGVIDHVTTTCPDQELEDEWELLLEPSLPTNQPPISQFFKADVGSSLDGSSQPNKATLRHKLYLCDVKTRAGQTLPQGSAFRPTQYQLMIYHSLLSRMVTDPIDFSVLADRYNLDATKAFSDSMIAQIGSLNDEVDTPSSDAAFPAWSQDSVTILLENNSLSALWKLMISTLQLLAPRGRESIGNILKAEYRRRETGEVMGSKTFPMDDGVLQRYIDYEMQWWKGERPPRGVEVEDAFKCRSCDFVATCDWRISMEDKERERIKETRLARIVKERRLARREGKKIVDSRNIQVQKAMETRLMEPGSKEVDDAEAADSGGAEAVLNALEAEIEKETARSGDSDLEMGESDLLVDAGNETNKVCRVQSSHSGARDA